MRVALVMLFLFACSSPANRPTSPTDPARPPTTGSAATEPDPTPPELRLPGDVRPQKYALELTLDPEETTTSGKLHVDARVIRPTRVVWMHAEGLTIAQATLGGVVARVVTGKHGLIGLVADRELPRGTLAIDIKYTAPIDRERSRGIYSEAEGEERYAYTFFEPIDARRAFPVFDEPGFKCPWQLTFRVKREHVALGNAPVVRTTDEPGGVWKRVELAPTKPLPSYLIAFVVGPFEVIDAGVGGRARTPIRFIVPRGRSGELNYAKEVTPKVVAALEQYFDMDYPFGKLDVAVVPRFWGTMEHPGLVAMGQPLTLIRPDQETHSRKHAYANILAHELAHYWFGDVVTMLWWDDTWLNEALGQWMDLIITDVAEPTWRVRDDGIGRATGAMNADETLSAQQIRQPVTTNEGIAASFDGEITYNKGSSVLRMFEMYVGEPKWRDFIRAHIRAHQWGNATADDLLKLARERLGAPIEAGLRSFIEQPGVPRITAKAACGAKPAIAIAQTRSLPAGTVDPTPRTWRVPVCLRYGDAKTAHQACVQLDGPTAELPAETCPTWIITNAGANGYYRSAVDPAVAKALLTPASAIAKSAKPTPAERMMLVTDVRAAVERGELGIEQVLALVPVIAADPDDAVALSAFEAASFRADAFDDALYAKARRYFFAAFGPRARQLGWTRAKTDTDDRHDLRRAFVPAAATADAVLGKQAETLADTWLAKRSGLEDDLVGPALHLAAYRGNQARFDQLLAATKTARDRAELQRILGSLGGFRDPKIAAQALELVRGKRFDLRDAISILYGVVFTRETRSLGIAFVQQHIDELLARMRDDEAAWFLGALAGGSCEASLRTTLGELVTPRAPKHDGAQAIVKRGLEQSAQCIAALDRQLPALRKFLAKY